jgi:hypothetical protein
MTPRELFDRAMAAVNAGDAEGLLALAIELRIEWRIPSATRLEDRKSVV